MFRKAVTSPDDSAVSGEHVGLILLRLLQNLTLQNSYTGETKTVTAIQLGFASFWDHQIPIDIPFFKMIDSLDFQHDFRWLGGFNVMVQPDGRKLTVSDVMPEPPAWLMGRAKAMGWIFSDGLPPAAYPSRLLFEFAVYRPGQTDGFRLATDRIEVIIADARAANLLSGEAKS